VFLYDRTIIHSIATDPAQPVVKYFVDFAGPAAATLLRRLGLSPGTVAQTSTPAPVMTIFDELIRAGLTSSPYSQRLCVALLQALLLKLAETRLAPGAVESPAFGTYHRCRMELETHALTVGTLGELARHCHVDPAYLCRLFRRFDHESPYRRLLRLKMNHAASRLQVPGILVKEVAAESGFADPYHFSRAFKSVLGISPRRFMQHGTES
jgi:AraC-like DNA-binding protein